MSEALSEETLDVRVRAGWAPVLNLVAELWALPVERKHLAGLAALAELFPQAGRDLAVKADAIPHLREAFDRHLRVPGEAALTPYETAHLPGGFQPRGPARIAQVAGIYEAAGFALEPFSHLLADHLTHELRFLAALVAREAELDGVAAANVRGWQAGFCADHVTSWLPAFLSHAERVGAHPFYRALAGVALGAAQAGAGREVEKGRSRELS